MKINIFCLSCEWTISLVDLPWGRYGCSSPAKKVLHVKAHSHYAVNLVRPATDCRGKFSSIAEVHLCQMQTTASSV